MPRAAQAPQPSAPRVAVIGAGICGIQAVKACKEQGLDVVGFEQEESLGGLWRFTPYESHSSVYKSTHINTSRDVNCYGDFPMPDGWPVALPHEYVVKYLQMFARHFDLMERLRFNTAVVSLKPHDKVNGKWRWALEFAPVIGEHPHRKHDLENATTEIFDHVFVCSGHHSTPRVPTWPGMEEFEAGGGRVVHSHAYKDNSGYRDRRVVVVGIGNSGGDIATEVSKVAQETTLVCRHGCWVWPNIWAVGKPPVVSRADGIMLGYCSPAIQSRINEKMLVGDKIKTLKKGNLTPDHRMTQSHPTVTQNNPKNNLFEQIEKGKVVGKRGIECFEGNRVKFVDGTWAEVDDLILCTGYKIGYKFLDPKVFDTSSGDNEVPLYMYMWPTNGFDTITFIGLIQAVGSMMIIAEMQSRVNAAIISGAINDPRPSTEAQIADIKRRRKINLEWQVKSPRHTIEACLGQYCDELGEWIGVTPTIARMLREYPRALPTVLLQPTTNYSYRLVGPGKWDGALQAMKKEHNIVYRRAPNRGSLLGWGQEILIFTIVLVFAFLAQLKNLLTKRKLVWRPWVY